MKEEILRELFPSIWEAQNKEAANAQKAAEILCRAVKDTALMDSIQERACIRWTDSTYSLITHSKFFGMLSITLLRSCLQVITNQPALLFTRQVPSRYVQHHALFARR